MAVVSYKRYSGEKDQFFRSHKNDFRIETSMMDEYGRYHKDYLFEDGAIWHEDMSPVFESATVEIKMVKVSVEVTVKNHRITDICLLRHENGKGYIAESMMPEMIEKNTSEVDTVSGATMSSKTIKAALRNALAKGSK